MTASRRRSKGDGSLYRRQSDGRYIGAVTLGYRDGKRIRKTVSGKKRHEVREKMKRLLYDQQQGNLPAPSRESLAAYLDRWLSDVVKPHRRPATYATYRSMVTRHIVPAIGPTPVQRLTAQQAQAFINGAGSEHLRKYLRVVLHAALDVAVKWGITTRNVIDVVEAPTARAKERKPLTRDEARLLLAALEGHPLRALYVLCMAAGLRPGEALALQWSDFEGDVLKVAHTLRYQNGKAQRCPPKTESSRRSVRLSRVAQEALQSHRMALSVAGALSGEGWVFPTARGAPTNINVANVALVALCASAGLPRITMHYLRHTYATLLMEGGVPTRVIADLLGHSSQSMTSRVYLHAMESARADGAGRIDEILGG
jgi:integrase